MDQAEGIDIGHLEYNELLTFCAPQQSNAVINRWLSIVFPSMLLFCLLSRMDFQRPRRLHFGMNLV